MASLSLSPASPKLERYLEARRAVQALKRAIQDEPERAELRAALLHARAALARAAAPLRGHEWYEASRRISR
jgi:hypothetical protein